jgi:outer membrane scaffolding protein for murein synthesis (MipA/OmpV family)
MISYFSVSAAQAMASGFAVHDASSGIKDVFIGVGTDVPLTDVWSLKLGARYSHLLGDAADSPIVETSEQFSGLVGLSYRFGLAR